ncbi:hypothetical protein BGZ76_010549 [Entomortierella beljakovae]|nr:hypothetical protein BGZ76_010549 [Entomortierella beljakovae]
MGPQPNLDSFTKIHLPPTFSSSQSANEPRMVPMKIMPTTGSHSSLHTPGYAGTTKDRAKPDIVKQEDEKSNKIAKPRKKRGQYKKTILRQQAEAAAAAVAAGLSPSQIPPPEPKHTSSAAANNSAKNKARAEESSAATIESLEVQHMCNHNKASSPTTEEMERELTMLAEEAEEDKKRREEEAADRILKRAQVVKHLRSLKSKLATAQIQIGHDLHYQSVDLFSQLYDEVLEDIGRDNSEMLNLLRNTHDQDSDSDQEESDSSSRHTGHMLTRSSDKPRKKDLVPSSSWTSNTASKNYPSEHGSHKSHVIELDEDSDNDSVSHRRGRRNKNSSQYVGQSWDIGSGRDGSNSRNPRIKNRTHSSQHGAHPYHETEYDQDILSLRKPHRNGKQSIPLPTRDEIQFKHRRELEQLQLQQRKDHEEFQRKQLEQLRELQMRQNQEMEEFDEAKVRGYRVHQEGVGEKRLKINQSQYSRKGEVIESHSRKKNNYPSSSISYEFENGFQYHSDDEWLSPSPSPSASPSPSPPPIQHPHRQPHDSQSSNGLPISSSSRSLAGRNGSTTGSTLSAPKPHKVNGNINSLPMSTMTIALTAMNEKKKQLKRAMKKQLEQEDPHDNDAENSDVGENHNGSHIRRFQSQPIWSQKRSAPEDIIEPKRSPSIGSISIQSHQSSAHRSLLHHPSSDNISHYRSSPTHTQAGSSEGSPSPCLNPKAKKRKNPMSPPSKVTHNAYTSDVASKSNIGFNKSHVNHFEKWNSDDKSGDFLDFILSDPPETSAAEAEVDFILNGDGQLAGQENHHDLNASLGFTNSLQIDNGTYGGSTLAELIPGENPLVTFTQSKRKSPDFGKVLSGTISVTATAEAGDDDDDADSSSYDNDNQVNHQISDIHNSSSFISGSSAELLYSVEGDWNFQPFSMDPGNEYLSNEGNKDFSLNF